MAPQQDMLPALVTQSSFVQQNCDYFIKVNSPKSLETMTCQPTKITEAIKSV